MRELARNRSIRAYILKNMTFPRASIHLWAEIFYEIYSTEVAEKKLVLYFSFLQQLLVRIPQICTVHFSCMSPVRIALYFRNFA